MAVSYAGIIMNVLMLIIIIVLVISAISFRSEFNQCKTQQNASCYQIRCPCDNDASGNYVAPCFGYAKMPGPQSGQWYCSNAPLAPVDINGNQIT